MEKLLAQLVRKRAQDACEYCRLPQLMSAIPFEIDHIIAQKHHGQTTADNLALSCFYCNSFKGANIAGMDLETKVITRLFNLRLDNWHTHFRWQGASLTGITAVGRTTIDVLGINSPDCILLRDSLLAEGIFPIGS